MCKYGVFSGLYFFAFGLNTESTDYLSVVSPNTGKCGSEKNFVFRHFSRSVLNMYYIHMYMIYIDIYIYHMHFFTYGSSDTKKREILYEHLVDLTLKIVFKIMW